MKELEGAAGAGDDRSALAIDVYLHRLRAAIAAMTAAMDGLDVLAFTGGVGEGSAMIRSRACEGVGFLGLRIDDERNRDVATPDREISIAGAQVAVVVLEAR